MRNISLGLAALAATVPLGLLIPEIYDASRGGVFNISAYAAENNVSSHVEFGTSSALGRTANAAPTAVVDSSGASTTVLSTSSHPSRNVSTDARDVDRANSTSGRFQSLEEQKTDLGGTQEQLDVEKQPSAAKTATQTKAVAAASSGSGIDPSLGWKNPLTVAADYKPRTPESLGSGMLSEAVEIHLPAFRGLEPKLTLQYSSGGGLGAGGLRAGWVGVGWDLDGVPDIVRTAPVNGTPNFDASDVYQLGGQDMIPCATGVSSPSCSAGGTHVTKSESYQRIKFENNIWTAWSKEGVRSVFKPVSNWGTVVDAGDTNPSLIRDGYRWLLAHRIDTHGNVVNYNYNCQTLPVCYPDTITYSEAEIKFVSTAHPGYQTKATGRGLAKLERQLKRIEVRFGGKQVGAYVLTQATSPSTGLQRLEQVQHLGNDWTVTEDGILGASAQPPTRFSYSDSQVEFAKGLQVIHPPVSDIYKRPFDLAGDFNGDGRQDVLTVTPFNPCKIGIQLSTPSGFSQPSIVHGEPNGAYPCGSPMTSNPSAPPSPTLGFSIADFDGDGLSDIYRLYKADLTIYLTRYDQTLSEVRFDRHLIPNVRHSDMPAGAGLLVSEFHLTGKSEIYSLQNQLLYSYENGAFSGTPLATSVYYAGYLQPLPPHDINGDGRPDPAAVTNYATRALTQYTVKDAAFSQLFSAIYPEVEGKTSAFASGDFNGDGASELATYRNFIGIPLSFTVPPIQVELSSGSALQGPTTLVPQMQCRTVMDPWYGTTPQPTGSCRHKVQAVDIDSDGRLDIVVSVPVTSSALPPMEVFLSRGGGVWERKLLQALSPYSFADLNGDGKVDIFHARESHTTFFEYPSGEVWYSTGPIPDLLTSVTYPEGGVVEVEYKPSSEWGLTAGTRMPFVTQTVSAIVEKDGRGGVSRTEYSYRGGRYDYKERKFLGFAGLTAKLPCASGETACPSIDITFSQAYAAIGKPLQIEYRDGAGVARKTVVSTYAIENTTAPYTALNTATETTLSEGGSSIVLRRENEFDAYGNVTQARDFGRKDITGDETWLVTSYVPNTADYIVSLPSVSSARSLTNGVFSTDSDVFEEQTAFYYDGATSETTAPTKGNLTMRRFYKQVEPVSSYVESFTYDTNGNKLSHVDGAGNRTEWDYDATYKLHVIKERAPKYFANGSLSADTRFVTTFTPNFVCGKPAAKVDWNGITHTYTYDAFCRPYGETNSGTGGYVNTRYENEGNPQTQAVVTYKATATGSGTVFDRSYYDGLGRTWRVETSGETASGQTRITDTTYDARGNKAQTAFTRYANEAAQWTVNSYDWQNRVVKTVNPDGSQRTYSYLLQPQSLANTTSVPVVDIRMTDEEGKLHRTVKDKNDNIILKASQLSGSWVAETRRYDMKGRLRQVKDHGGATWTYTYDLVDNRLTAKDPDLGSWSYRYDNAKRLTGQTDARGAVTTLAYDQIGRLRTKSVKGAGETTATTTVTNTYDTAASGIGAAPFHNVGLLTRAVNGTATHHYSMSQTGNGTILTTTSIIDGITHTMTERKGKPDLTLAISYTPAPLDVGTSAAPWSYNAANELLAIPGHVTAATYEADGQTKSIAYANGVTTEFTYSPTRRWMTRVVTKKGTTVLMDNQYTRDKLGRIKTITGLTPSENWTYTYDDLGQLTQAVNAGNSALSETYTYSPSGNLLSRSRVSGVYQYPSGTASRPHAATQIGAKTIAYDANGNMTSDGTRTLTWDRSNLLASVTEGTSTATFAYGPDGSRAIKASPSSKTLYVNANIEIDRTTPGSEVYVRYPHPDVKISTTATNATTPSYLHRDHLQSVRLVTGQSGGITEQTGYAAYGEATNQNMQTKKGYIGERFDAETGLMYLNARYYDPTFGRFIPPDEEAGPNIHDEDIDPIDLQGLQINLPQSTNLPAHH
ncbi:toxin TcdB middle/N-terminal domain-containing protein [Agrobacterium sp. 22117]|uniref:toxin TcdB middle/N-terminal domain-containing protein n=1 Tax=Agrobacterium sp. 22117 TaxID=3453880 RepID=UPI003F83029F